MESNFWFYSLSAIPQTLAAMITLAATFVVFKLNFIQEKIRDIRKDLRRFILLLTSYEKKEIHHIEPLSDEDFLNLYDESLKSIKPNEKNLGLNAGVYERLRAEMSRIIYEDWKSGFSADENRVYGYLNAKKVFSPFFY